MKITKAKNKLEAVKQLSTQLLLVSVGSSAVWIGAKDQVIEPQIALTAGAVCLLVGLAPMFWAYLKELFK